jgi:DNA helicase-2/ATP-dependent DNA helicase PcrA
MTTEIILGPPGTGKTTTLLGEVEKELARGTPPDRIGYVTFTTKGANEARERACERFKLDAKQLPYFRTLHSMCYRALQISNGDMLVGKAFFEFANHASIKVTGRSWSDDGLLTGFEQGDRALFMENLARIRQVSLREMYDENPDGMNWNYVARISRTLAEFKMDRGLLDYTDMLVQFVAEDRDMGLIKLFVDEAQDLSSLQWAVVDLLARSCDRVVVAGDDDQAIFRWAGADVEHLIAMPGKSRVLGRSYRCPPVIQELSDQVISPVRHRRPKKWKAKPGGSGVIDHAPNFFEVDLASEGSVLVLARNSYILQKQVEPALRAEGVVYEIAGKSSLDPDLVRAAAAWEDLRKGDVVSLGDARKMYKFIATNTGVKKGYKTLPKYGDDEDEPVTMADLLQTGGLLVDPTKIWHDALDRMPQGDMSYMLAARRRGERLRGGKPRVKLSTIHSAKGGEADHVVVMKEMARRTHEEMHLNPDDERRCWYVGVTRTRQRLTVVASQTEKECPWI